MLVVCLSSKAIKLGSGAHMQLGHQVVGLERFGPLVWLGLLDHLQCSFIWVAVGLGFSAVVLCIRGPQSVEARRLCVGQVPLRALFPK